MLFIQTIMISDFPVEINDNEKISSDKGFDMKERFKGMSFFHLLNANQTNKRKMPPIKIEQTTLIKFFPSYKINPLTSDRNRCPPCSKEQSYTLVLEPDKSIHIKETHCLQCGDHLIKNGSNTRKLNLVRSQNATLIAIIFFNLRQHTN